jgi:DNA-binding transcriptional MerR regulator
MLPFEDEAAMIEPELPLPEGQTSFKPEELYRFTRIKPFVLRFWESEFPLLKPQKKGTEGPQYTRADVELILAIKRLLYDEGLTLPEARERLAGEGELVSTAAGSTPQKTAATRKTVSKPAPGRRASEKIGGDSPKKKKTESAATAAAPILPEKGRGKRGLPGDVLSRSRVSLEELLPGNGVAAGAGSGAAEPELKKSSTPDKTSTRTPPRADTEVQAMRRKLSVAVRELREILTFLHKGDR